MTIYQDAHAKIDPFPEETVQIFVQLMGRMKASSWSPLSDISLGAGSQVLESPLRELSWL